MVRGERRFSCSMLMGKLARRRESIVGAAGSEVRSLTTRRGVGSKGLILGTSTPSMCSFTTWPATHGKLAETRSRPFFNVLMIAGCEEGSGSAKQRHI